MLDERVDREDLAGLQVDPDLDRQPRVLPQSVVGRPSRQKSTSRGASARTAARRAFAYTHLPMRRVALLSMVLIVLAVAGCGGSKSYTLEDTRACLEARGAQIGGELDFVASTATGGAFVAGVGDNSVKVVFGETERRRRADRARLRPLRAAEREGRPPRRAPPPEQRRDAVAEHPQDSDLALVTGCLK